MQKGIIKNVNRITGEPIDAKDLASLFSGIIGEESGVLTVFDELRLEKINDNKVRLHSGVYSLKGHILYIPKGSYEDFDIESGTLGANRIDLLVAEFAKNGEGDGEDTLQFKIVKGETSSGSPQRPDLIQQDINENGITRQEVLYELRLTGTNLTIQNREKKIKSLKSVEDLAEEVNKKLVHREGSMTFYGKSYADSLSIIRFGNLVSLNARFRHPDGFEPGDSSVGLLHSGFRPKDLFVSGAAVTQGYYPDGAFNISREGVITVYNRRSSRVNYIHITVVFEAD